MLFYMITLNLVRFLIETALKLNEDGEDVQTINAFDTWKHLDFICWNNIMNNLSKELWESLDPKYKFEDVGASKFIVNRFLNLKLVDSKIIVNQVQEFKWFFMKFTPRRWIWAKLFKLLQLLKSCLRHEKISTII